MSAEYYNKVHVSWSPQPGAYQLSTKTRFMSADHRNLAHAIVLLQPGVCMSHDPCNQVQAEMYNQIRTCWFLGFFYSSLSCFPPALLYLINAFVSGEEADYDTAGKGAAGCCCQVLLFKDTKWVKTGLAMHFSSVRYKMSHWLPKLIFNDSIWTTSWCSQALLFKDTL